MFTKKRFLAGFLLLLLGLVTAVTAVASSPVVESDVEILYSFTGEQVGDVFGWVGADLGDITGDGVHEMLIPAILHTDANGFPVGKLYVYDGSNGALLHSVTGEGVALLGYSASSAGDVNGDGTPDYVGGAPYADYASVYSGADHSELLRLEGEAGEFFGVSVAGAGDVNDDGYGDLIVGATSAAYSFTGAGRVYLFSGADGSILWTADGPAENAELGTGVGLVGDVDGDGTPDQVAGAASSAKAYVFSGATGEIVHTLAPVEPDNAANFGRFFASGAGDYDQDGTPDIFVADYSATVDGVAGTGNAFVYSGADGRVLLALNGREPGGGFGPGRATEDLDGDGYVDLVIGAWTSSGGAPAAGQMLVISGRGPKPARVIQRATGAVEGDNLGVDALPVGDVNGDGHVDFMVTAVGNAFAGTEPGHVYVIAGGPNLPLRGR